MRSFKLLSISILSVLGLVFMLASNAPATTVNSEEDLPAITINGSEFDNTKLMLNEQTGNYSYSDTAYEITIGPLSFDLDPYLAYGVAVTNNSIAPQSFFFSWVTPGSISLPAGPTVVTSSLTYSGTDISPSGVQVAPPVGGYIQKSYLGATDLGVSLQNYTFSCTPPTGSFNGPSGLFATAAGPGGPLSGILKIETAFTLSGNDIVTMNGITTINPTPTPIPPTGVLLLFGLVGMVGIKKKFSLTDKE